MRGHPGRPLEVLVAGGGPAALEAALALQALAEERVRIALLAPEESFAYRPASVVEPFGLGQVSRFSLSGLAAERGFEHLVDAAVSIDPTERRVALASGASIGYDALLVAIGAQQAPALPGALTFRDSRDAATLRDALSGLGPAPRRVAFVAAPSTAWTLPLYELSILTAGWAAERDLGIETWLVTHEARALGLFGEDVAVHVADLLERAGVRLWTGSSALAVEDGRLWLDLEGGLPVDLAVALPRPVGPRIPGLPCDEQGFLPVDGQGLVRGVAGVYAAGDVTARPLRQGGLATQQADAVAAAIAVQAGAEVEARAYRPALRGLLLTGRRPEYLTRVAGERGEISEDAPWWPPHKIAGRHLSPYLAAHPELREPVPATA